MLKSLRRRFVSITMAIVACMLLIIFGLIFYFTMSDLDTKSDNMLQTLAQAPHGPPANISLPCFTIQINGRSEILATGNTHYNLTDEAFIRELIDKLYRNDQAAGKIDDLKYIIVTLPGMNKLCFVDISSHRSTLSSLLQACIIIGIVSVAIFAYISILLARWSVKPIEQAWLQQKQFVSDASHELKTPLTIMLSNTELLIESEALSEHQQQMIENIMTSSRQMRHLVNGLLELARADNGQIQTNFSSVDFSKHTFDSLLPLEPLFYEKGLTLQYKITPDIHINGSSHHLQQLIDILLDNAKKYSDPGIVELKLSNLSKSECLLTVSNPGTPIPKDELTAIFRRFYRSDTARTSSGSFGLGLAIAQRIVQVHNGKIWAESNANGNSFFVLLPCIPK